MLKNFYKSVRQHLSAALALFVGLFLIPVHTIGQDEYPYEQSERPAGRGTENDPFIINDIYNLLWIAEQVNSGDELSEKYFVQQQDIDMSVSQSWDNGEGWMPIGGFYYMSGILKKLGFKGFYDGKGHKIINLKINRPDMAYQALFGYVYIGQISHLILQNIDVVGLENVGGIAAYMHDAEIIGCQVADARLKAVDFYVGGITGYQDRGFIKDCIVEANIEGRDYVGGISSWINEGDVQNCVTRGSIKGLSHKDNIARLTGGITGYTLRSYIELCASYADVKGGEKVGGLIGSVSKSEVFKCCAVSNEIFGDVTVGGLLGENDNSIIQDCFARSQGIKGSQNVGGLIGSSSYVDSSVKNCYAVAPVIAENEAFAGGLIGVKSTGVVSNCYWNKDICGLDGVGGFYHEDIQCNGKNEWEMKDQATYANWDFDNIWKIQDGINDNYPAFIELLTEDSSLNPKSDSSLVHWQFMDNSCFISASVGICQVRLYDLSGNIVLQKNMGESLQCTVVLDKGLAGIYLLQISLQNDEVLNFKVNIR